MLFLKFLKKYKKLLAFALLLATINQVFSLLDPQIIRLLIDNYATNFNELSKQEFFSGVLLLLGGFVGVAFVSRVAKNFQDYYVNAVTQHLGTDMYAESVEHTFSLPYSVFEDRRSGEVLQKMQKARQDSQILIEKSINIVFLSMVGMTFVLVYAFYVHWLIGLTFILSMPTMGVFIFLISKRVGKYQKIIVKENAELAGSTTETLRNVELVKSLGLEKQEIQRLNNTNNKILALELKKIKYIRLLSFIQGTVVNGVRAILLFVMLYLLYNGNVSIGEFLSLFFYSFFLFAPLGEIGTVIANYQEAKASNEQLEEILNIKPEKKHNNIKTIKEINYIEMKDVSFKYSEGKIEALKDINLKINKGERVAFAGPSGSGKTTITKLILGLYKSSKGNVNYNGIDIKNIDLNNLIKRIGNGLDTKIGEGGIKLSGGERQRLAIARALLREPELLIFDEATSALDSLTEKDITDTIKKISKERPNLIIITIAHRLSTIAHVDNIYVLEKGKIVEKGNHKELLNKKGLYAALWREQIAED